MLATLPLVVLEIGCRLWTGRSALVFRNEAHTKYFTDLKEWTRLLADDIAEHVLDLQSDGDIYGFTLSIPEDLELYVTPGIARESNLGKENSNSLNSLDRRYCPDWEFLAHGKYYTKSFNFLEQTLCKSQRHETLLTDSIQSRLLNEFHYACLDAMVICNRRSAFGNIWFKMLYVSDSDFAIVKRSFYKLNRLKALKEGAAVYPRFDWITALALHVLKTVRIRYARWKIGAKR